MLLSTLLACAVRSDTTVLSDVEVVTLRRSYDNAHVVRTAGMAVLVDAGLERDAPALAGDLSAAGIDPAALDLLVLTHGHADHAGGAAWFHEAYGIPVLAGEGDLALLEEGHNDPLCPTDATGRRRLEEAQAETYTPVVPTFLVPVDQSLDLAELGLRGRVTSVPGHTPGSLVLQVGEAVFVGDLIRGSVTGRAARTHFYQCDLEGNRADVAAVLDTLAPDASTWFPGHFGPLDREDVRAWAE